MLVEFVYEVADNIILMMDPGDEFLRSGKERLQGGTFSWFIRS